MFSSCYIINMERLATVKYKQTKTLKASSENNWESVPTNSLNSKGKEEALECIKYISA